MKRLFSFILVTALLLTVPLALSSCKVQRPLSDRELMRSAGSALSAFAQEAFRAGTDISEEVLTAFSGAPRREGTLSLLVSEISVADRNVVTADAPVSLELNTHTDTAEGKLSLAAALELFGDKLSFELYSDGGKQLGRLPELFERYIKLPGLPGERSAADMLKALKALTDALCAEVVRDEYFTRETLDYTYDSVGVKNATRLTLDLSSVDFPAVALTLLPKLEDLLGNEAYDSLSPAIEEALRGQEYKLDECELIFWFKGEKLIGGELIASAGGKRAHASFTINKDDSLCELHARLCTGTADSEREVISLDFNQLLKDGKKNGNLDIIFSPQHDADSLTPSTSAVNPLTVADGGADDFADSPIPDLSGFIPERISLKTTFNTTIEGNRQNTQFVLNIGSEMYGITSSFNIPLNLLTDFKDGELSAIFTLNGTFFEMSTVKAQLSFLSKLSNAEVSIPTPSDDEIYDPENDTDTDIRAILTENLKKNCPQLYEMFAPAAEPDIPTDTGVFYLSNESDPREYSLSDFFDDGDDEHDGLCSGPCGFTRDGERITITEHGQQPYTLDLSDDEAYTSDEFGDMLVISDEDGCQWVLSSDTMTGTFYIPFICTLDLNGETSGTITFFPAHDGVKMFAGVTCEIGEFTWRIDGTEYTVSKLTW